MGEQPKQQTLNNPKTIQKKDNKVTDETGQKNDSTH
jgi:hypothetical protein